MTPDPRTCAPQVWVPDVTGRLVEELVGLATVEEGEILAWVRRHGFVGIRARQDERFETIEEIRLACGRLGQAWALASLLRRGSSAPLVRPAGGALPRLVRALCEGWHLDPPALEQADLLQAAEAVLPGARAELAGRAPWAIFAPPGGPTGLTGPELARALGLVGEPAHLSEPTVEVRLQLSYLCLTLLRDHVFEGLLRVAVDVVPQEDGAAFRLRPAIRAAGPLATAYLQVLEAVSWPAALAHRGSAGLGLRWRAARQCLHCGKIYRPHRRGQKWCSSKCCTAAWHDRQRDSGNPPTAARGARRTGST